MLAGGGLSAGLSGLAGAGGNVTSQDQEKVILILGCFNLIAAII